VSFYIVKTQESVAGTYRVEAESAEDAKSKFGDPKIDWSAVEQIDYVAFSLAIESVLPETEGEQS
jgi:hypothetical protein